MAVEICLSDIVWYQSWDVSHEVICVLFDARIAIEPMLIWLVTIKQQSLSISDTFLGIWEIITSISTLHKSIYKVKVIDKGGWIIVLDNLNWLNLSNLGLSWIDIHCWTHGNIRDDHQKNNHVFSELPIFHWKIK